ncbi:hypothetical protein QEO74_gp20 [Arthrobacter phage Nandita]|uniref:Uncharacterized protein n=1 Tax=Arthrobacter phage Nandita TaxID=2419963 RepID=A0A3G2KIG3_9CAUD|nr:hypothetical protein QEO74_gp20 [Arthrobacter phage Nandita]AYN58670.1 hypothetical protein PBI_NANDITA_51 [Arthrobacter phage Nandita]
MPNRLHGLARNAENEAVCLCGFRPEIHDSTAPVGRDWKAKAIILDHAASLNNDLPERRSPDAPFTGNLEAKYPRAGVRRKDDGKWHLTLWDAPGVQHTLEEPDFAQRGTAFDYGWMTIGACRQSGTNLNGLEAVA